MNDVIAAISTAWGEGAIAIVRLSGEGSVALADRFFVGRKPLAARPPRYLALGNIVDRANGGAVVDEVLAVRFAERSSYTGEEAVEVHCHGGAAAAQRCLEIFLREGARLAQPGEFTKRAFLSGRIDLAQAEAVLSVVRAGSDAALLSAERALQGQLSTELRELMGSLTDYRAALEVRIDYPEEVEPDDVGGLVRELREVRSRAAELTERCRTGAMLRNGLSVAILGRPNVGKSSLLNALCGEERAIVTDIPGTTRDTVDAVAMHRGLAMRMVDTAGIRESEDPIENMGVERSRNAMAGADIRLLVLDASNPLHDEDRSILRSLDGAAGRNTLLVLNKSDLPILLDLDEVNGDDFSGTLFISAKHGGGLDELRERIFELAVGDRTLDASYAATERMVEALARAGWCMDEAAAALEEIGGVDVAGSMLAEAAVHMGSLLGLDATEELLDTIFSMFCVGK